MRSLSSGTLCVWSWFLYNNNTFRSHWFVCARNLPTSSCRLLPSITNSYAVWPHAIIPFPVLTTLYSAYQHIINRNILSQYLHLPLTTELNFFCLFHNRFCSEFVSNLVTRSLSGISFTLLKYITSRASMLFWISTVSTQDSQPYANTDLLTGMITTILVFC